MPDTISKTSGLASDDLGNATSETQFTNSSGSLVTLQIPVSAANLNKPLRVIAGGRVISGASNTFTGKLYFGNSTTVASNALVETEAVTLTASTQQIWLVEAIISVTDANSSEPGTIALSFLNPSGTAGGSTTTNDPALLVAVLNVTGQFTSSDSSNAAYLDFFEIQSVVS